LDQPIEAALAGGLQLAKVWTRVRPADGLAETAASPLGLRLSAASSVADANQNHNTAIIMPLAPHGGAVASLMGVGLSWPPDVSDKRRSRRATARSDVREARAAVRPDATIDGVIPQRKAGPRLAERDEAIMRAILDVVAQGSIHGRSGQPVCEPGGARSCRPSPPFR
jgi:hypothetical protein